MNINNLERALSLNNEKLFEFLRQEIEVSKIFNQNITIINDSPIGSILSYMGNTPPKHYLICDGTEYNITDYPLLATHIKEQFFCYNYFGGDGQTTFCVPDLRGEFLRGTGTSNYDSGSGNEVGKHQEPTICGEFQDVYKPVTAPNVNGLNISIQQANEGQYNNIFKNVDKYYFSTRENSQRDIMHFPTTNRWSDYTATNAYGHSLRPTNTSVLYCIKYEPAYHMKEIVPEEQQELELLRKQNTLLKQEIEQLEEIIDKINRCVIT